MILRCFSLGLAKSTNILTQVVSHPAFWHFIDPTLSGGTISPHRHRDKPLMSRHRRLRPTRVGSESKNRRPEPDGSGSDRSATGFDFICICPMCIASESMETWRKPEPSGPGVLIGMDSGIATDCATRTRYQQGNPSRLRLSLTSVFQVL